MPLATHVASEPGLSAAELGVEAIARRRATSQLMRVAWPRFRKAYEEYPRWHALTLWTHAIIASQGEIPPWLIADLQKRCPGLTSPEGPRPESLDLRLSEWVRNQKFGYAKRQGWIDALTFYGVRHARSDCAWNYWERCDRGWNKNKPKAFPTFDVWWCDAQKMKLCDKVSYREIDSMIQKYLDWEAMKLWVRPVFAANVKIPPHLFSELKKACPGITKHHDCGTFRGHKENSEMWQDLMRCCRDRFLSDAKRKGVLDLVLQRTHSHPLHARLVLYGTHWSRKWLKNRKQPLPSFRKWRRVAESFVHTGRI